MTWTDAFTESFVRGIGKSSAVLLVVGAVTGIYYVATTPSFFIRNLRSRPKVSKHDKDTRVSDDTDEGVLEGDMENEAEHITSEVVNSNVNYCSLFDSLRRS